MPHFPVLLEESVDFLVNKKEGTYIDCTYGRGGHTQKILETISSNSQLTSFDKDSDAIEHANHIQNTNFKIIQDSFSNINKYFSKDSVDGILYDLGTCSTHFDDASRGFSFRHNGPLDMRFDTKKGKPLADWINKATENDIKEVLYKYGDEKHAKLISLSIVEYRNHNTLDSTLQLANLIQDIYPDKKNKIHPATKSFQAFRIHLNDELTELSNSLIHAKSLLKKNGIVVVISFHSLEDNIVKNFFKAEIKNYPKDIPINNEEFKEFECIAKKVRPSAKEIELNKRSRSAIMRVFKKIMTNKQNSILILMLISIIFLSLEKIKLSFEINRLNNNQENLFKEHESFKDKNIKLITQSYTNNSPAYIERIAKEDLGMVKRKPKTIIKSITNEKINFINWRLFVTCFCLVGAIFAVVFKIILVQVEDSLFLQNEGKKRYIKYREINPVRGAIYDRNKFPLAVSIINYDLYALKGLNIDKFLKLKDLMEIDEDISIIKPFKRKTLLKKGLTAEDQSIIEDLNFNELEIEIRHSRHYPLGEQIAPLVGFYGKDRAQEGLEKSYDSILSGKTGKQKFYKNAKQEIISKPIDIEKSIKGQDIVLTIDSTIQFYSYKYLVEAIVKNKAKAGTVLVFDNLSGEILAIASYPSYNPNNSNRSIQKNRALVDAYELGSVIKPIVFSKAVDEGVINPDELMELPRRLRLGKKIISDTKNYVQLTPKEIIAHSSQVGASKIALGLGYDALKTNYYNFGFSKPISINFPSAAFGLINSKEEVSNRELASMGYGYGFTVSPYQITSAYSTFANKGIRKDFKLLMNDEVTYKRVISKESADHTLDALKKVVEFGTGKKANIDGFTQGGKTGTVHRIRSGSGYAEDLYRASFVGITPISEKSLTIFVSIEDPGLNAYSGGMIAAPLFAEIAESSLNYLGYLEDE